MIATRFRTLLLLTSLAATAAAIGCDDPTTIERHLEVEGFALFEGTTEIYRYTLDDGTPAPALSLATGTHDVIFALLDHEGGFLIDEGHQEDEHEEHEIRVTIQHTGVLTWMPEAEGEAGPHDFIEFHGQLEALQTGATTMTVCVPHEGHCDFSIDVPVSITEP